MARIALPPGFGFHPTDEELVAYYLKRKVHGHKIEMDVIPEVDLYKCEPWDLPDKSYLPSKDLQWHFFSPRDKKYPNGSRTNRATEAGYWKATGKDRKVSSHQRKIGTKKTLVFYTGRAPLGERTGWIMHEYRLDEKECQRAGLQDAFVLCRVFNKNGLGTKDDEKCPVTNENNDSSSTKNGLSPGTQTMSFYVKDQIEGSLPLLPQEKDAKENLQLLLEQSREIFNNITEDSVDIDKLLDMVLDNSEQDNGFTSADEFTSNAKVDVMWEAPALQQATPCPPLKEGERIPTNTNLAHSVFPNRCEFWETAEGPFEASILEEPLYAAQTSQADNSHQVDYFFDMDSIYDYLELNDFTPQTSQAENSHQTDGFINFDSICDFLELNDLPSSPEELENNSSPVQGDYYLGPMAPEIQIRQRMPEYKCQTDLSGMFTANHRIRKQVYPRDNCAKQYHQDMCISHSQTEPNNLYLSESIYDLQEQEVPLNTFNRQNHNSKVVTSFDAPLLTLPREMNNLKEGLLDDHFQGICRSLPGDYTQPNNSGVGSLQSNIHRFSNPLHSSSAEGELAAHEIQQFVHPAEINLRQDTVDFPSRVMVSHAISSMPLQSSTYGLLLDYKPSEIVEMCVKPFLTTGKQDGNGVEKQQLQPQKLLPSTEHGEFVSKINLQGCLGECSSDVDQKCTVAVNQQSYMAGSQKCDIEASEGDSELKEFHELVEGSASREVLYRPGMSSEELHPDYMESVENSLKVESVEGGQKPSRGFSKLWHYIPLYATPVMAYLAELKPAKIILPLIVPRSFGPKHAPTVTPHIRGTMLTSNCMKECTELAESSVISSLLTHRGKSRRKGTVSDGEEKQGECMEELCDYCAYQYISGTLGNLEQPSSHLNFLSDLLKRAVPAGSNRIIGMICLMGAPLLLIFFLVLRGIWRFARSPSTIIFQ